MCVCVWMRWLCLAGPAACCLPASAAEMCRANLPCRSRPCAPPFIFQHPSLSSDCPPPAPSRPLRPSWMRRLPARPTSWRTASHREAYWSTHTQVAGIHLIFRVGLFWSVLCSSSSAFLILNRSPSQGSLSSTPMEPPLCTTLLTCSSQSGASLRCRVLPLNPNRSR